MAKYLLLVSYGIYSAHARHSFFQGEIIELMIERDFLKRLKTQKSCLIFILILGVFIVLPGCGGEAGAGPGDQSPAMTSTVSSTSSARMDVGVPVGAVLDIIAPAVTATAPLDLATGVATDDVVTAIFNETIKPATIRTATFTVKETVLGIDVPGTVVLDGTTAIFSPLTPLKPDTDYLATVTVGVQDLAGNALIVPGMNGLPVSNPWTFRTEAAVIPSTEPLAIDLGQAGRR
jgi:hypothetical protein